MSVHVAIMHKRYLRLILEGTKTVESRLTRTTRAPHRRIEPGERIFFKCSCGPYMATAIAGDVEFFENLAPAKVQWLHRHYNNSVCGDDEYWQYKRDSRFATFVTLRHVHPTDMGPTIAPSRGLAWFVLADDQGPPWISVKLTAGAIRNRYLRVPRRVHQFPTEAYGGRASESAGKPIGLIMPDGNTIRTDVVNGGMFRWRGWGAYFDRFKTQPGDYVTLAALSPWRYRVYIGNCSTEGRL